MICLACDGKLKPIKEDLQTWKRKYHKKCWHERFMYYDLVNKCEKLGIVNEDYLKRCCMK